MAKKLSDDHLRIILDIEAKGVQAELQKITSESLRFADANKTMAKEMKEAEKQVKEAEKQLKRLEESGQRGSRAYKEWQGTLESAKAEVADYKLKIEQNTKSIDENNKKHAGIIKTMSIEDMTMSQLKNRASELQKQMNNTSASLSPEAYKKLGQELDQVNKRITVVNQTNKSLLEKFAAMNNPVGTAARAVQGFGQALKMLMANPVVAVIAAVVAIFYALRDALFKNEEAMNALNRIMAPFKALFDALVNVLQEAVVWVLKFVESIVSGISKAIDKFPILNKLFGGLNEKMKEGAQLEREKQAHELQSRKNMEENAKKETQIAKLRNESKRKDLYTDQQRLDKLNEAVRLEKEISATKVAESKETLRLLELEAKRTKNATELERKISEARVAVENAEREQYSNTIRLQSEISSTNLEMQRERTQAAKEAIEKRLQNEENALNQEINKLKQARKDGLLTEKEYNKKVEEETIAALHRKINIKGQEKEKIIQLESQLLDAQIKQQTEADKILLDELTKENKNQLQLLESAKNTQLELLQEQETDQKIYALRAAEIEAETAKAREDVIRAFGISIEQAEWQNNKIRLDAIEANSKEIISAETATLKEQEKRRKLFAKTTADFERQYNIKTWEQRKSDELRILEKQHTEGLMSDETYQLALKAVHKKYEDEKLKIRQQYGIATMQELYTAEMDALQEQHEKGLLSEEEFEAAKLQLKLKYAQQYAQLSQEFIQAGSNAVKAIEEAETAKTETEYAKRQSALTEQYNQGIISQEEYNTQKEQLDYEQKSKELEIQKKYADVNFAMQVAQIIATTAQGIITAWSTAMTLGPIAGPIMGAALTALLGVTSAAQISKAKSERDRVKAMTLESPGSGGDSAPKTGQIRLREGFAEGGYNASAGGYTGNGGKYEVAGYVPVHGGEYVIAREELRQPEIMNMARAIERERRKRTNKNAIAGFADGGSNLPAGTNPGMITLDSKSADRIAGVLERLETGDIVIKTNYGVTELEAEQRKKLEAESKFTKS